ncbi:zincin-like metallopeptidase domain-containing protein [Neisseria sp. Ec49-e6-T10]|uniref:zincin-like metallopeptidase domain-containing protein n=1 Tax=Neisseria sp. Ec49-e6-T10 TaxID=3140744 RepID=UPI003EBE230C
MADYLKEVLIRRTHQKNQKYRPEEPTTGGLQNIYGDQIESSPFLRSIIDHPQFNGDPRIATKEEIEQSGFKIKESEYGVEGVKYGKNKEEFQKIEQKFEKSQHSDEDKKKFEEIKKEYLTTYYNGNQIESDKNEFKPYINEFDVYISEEQEKQLKQLESMAESIGVEIRHFGDKKLTSTDYETIHLPTKEHFVSPNAYMQVLAHELIHATKYKTPQFNDETIPEPKAQGDTNYVVDEWRAEVGSVLLMDKLGIDYNLDLNAYYLNSWSSELEQNIPIRNLTVDERWDKIEQAIDSVNFLLKKSGLEPMLYTDEEIDKLQKINEAYPSLPRSLFEKEQILNNPDIDNEVKKVYDKLYEGLAPTISEKAGDKWVTPLLTETTYASIARGLTADKIKHLGINEENDVIFTIAKNYWPFATVDSTKVSNVNVDERLQEASQIHHDLTKELEQKQLERQLQLAQQQERGGRGFG